MRVIATFVGIAAYLVSLVLGGIALVSLLILTCVAHGSLSDWELGSFSWVLLFLFFGFVTSPLAFLGDRLIRHMRWPRPLSDALAGAVAVASLLAVLRTPSAFPNVGWPLVIGEGALVGALMGMCYWVLRGKVLAEIEEGVRLQENRDGRT